MSFLKDLFVIFLISVIFVIAFSAYVFLTYAKPRRFVSGVTPENFNLTSYDNVILKTDDGISLKGWYIYSKTPTDKAIIICHGYPMDKGNVLSLAPVFHSDYNILLFDFRSMGESGGFFTTFGLKEINDFNAAVNYLRDRNIKEIGALGFSLGGVVIILANNPYVSAIISDSAYAELDMMTETVYGNFFFMKYPFIYFTKLIAKIMLGIDTSDVSPLRAIKNLKTPTFLIHSKSDTEVDVKHSELLHKAYPSSELWIVQSAGHGEIFYMYADEYKGRVLSFFKKHIKPL